VPATGNAFDANLANTVTIDGNNYTTTATADSVTVNAGNLSVVLSNDAYVTLVSTLEHIGLGFYDGDSTIKRGDHIAIEKIYKLLKKNGKLLLTVPFGVKHENNMQRIYDWKTLRDLFKNYSITSKLFYKDVGGKWILTSMSDASSIKSDNVTNAVCFIEAQKK